MTALLTQQAGVGVQVHGGSGVERVLEVVTYQQPCDRKTIRKHHHAQLGLWALSWALQAPLITESGED